MINHTHTQKKNDKVEDDLKLSYQKRSKKKRNKMSEKKAYANCGISWKDTIYVFIKSEKKGGKGGK